jgi:hypothetical protein
MTNIEERPGAASKELERIASDTIPIYDENVAIEPDFLADVTAAIEAGDKALVGIRYASRSLGQRLKGRLGPLVPGPQELEALRPSSPFGGTFFFHSATVARRLARRTRIFVCSALRLADTSFVERPGLSAPTKVSRSLTDDTHVADAVPRKLRKRRQKTISNRHKHGGSSDDEI